MRVLAALAREHRIFLDLIARVERALDAGEDSARADVRESLLVLVPALARHEEIEDSALSRLASGPGATAIGPELEREHARVRALSEKVAETMGGSDKGWDAFKGLVLELARALRGHFELEELRLWPRFERSRGRSRDRAAGAKIDRAVRRLTREVERNRLEVSDYLRGSR